MSNYRYIRIAGISPDGYMLWCNLHECSEAGKVIAYDNELSSVEDIMSKADEHIKNHHSSLE